MPDERRPLRLAARSGPPLLLLALFVTLLLASAGARQAGEAEARDAARPAITIFLVRHAEKAVDGSSDPGLLRAGEERAEALAHALGAARVTHLYSTDYRRTVETLTPLAARTGLAVARYDPSALPRLVDELRGLEPGSVAVVAGHSNTTPVLYEALGGRNAADLDAKTKGAMLPEEAYDRLYEVVLLRDEREEATRCVAALELRYGDE